MNVFDLHEYCKMFVKSMLIYMQLCDGMFRSCVLTQLGNKTYSFPVQKNNFECQEETCQNL